MRAAASWISLLLTATAPGFPSPAGPHGWAGADLADARRVARESCTPLLVFYRREDCVACDEVERLLIEDPSISALTSPYVRLKLSSGDPRSDDAARSLLIGQAPAVLLLGPGGREATRREGDVDRLWLFEQLQIVARRTRPLEPEAEPGSEALRQSLLGLEGWGDREGAVGLRRRLGVEAVSEVEQLNASLPDDETQIGTLLSSAASMDEAREMSRRLAERLEDAGRPRLALSVYRQVLERLDDDPLTEARAAFLATRLNLDLESARQRLVEARRLHPSSLPVLMALARVGERSRRLYLAYHAVETAVVYEPTDAWIRLELRRLRLLVRLKAPGSERDPV